MTSVQEHLVKRLLSQRGRLIGYITTIVRDHHLAEDVFQEVALLVIRKSDQLHDDDTFVGWLFRAARFEALNAARKRRRGPQLMDENILDLLDDHWLPQAHEDDGFERLTPALRACIEHLTERSRRLVNLRYGRGLSGKELAAKLQRPINTVYVALTRIHRTLLTCVTRTLKKQEAVS